MSLGSQEQPNEKAKELMLFGAELVGSAAGEAISFFASCPLEAAGAVAAGVTVARLLAVVSDFAFRQLSRREKVRVGAGIAFAAKKISKYLQEGRAPRNDGFFDPDTTGRSQSDEILEGVLLKCKNEPEEKKLHFIGNIYANVAFAPGLSIGEANHILRSAEEVTYRQMCVLSLLLQKDYIHSLPDLALRQGFSFITREFPQHPREHELVSLFQEVFELYNRGLVLFRGKNGQRLTLARWTDVQPDRLQISKVGARQASVMGLEEMPRDDLDSVLSLLSESQDIDKGESVA
jgi:hypothetical protein